MNTLNINHRFAKPLLMGMLLIGLCHTTVQAKEDPTPIASYWNTQNFQKFGEQLTTDTAKADQAGAKVILYRPPSDSSTTPVSIYINGDYQASLMPGGFTQQNLCAGSQRIGIASGNTDRTKPVEKATLTTQNQHVYFLEVRATNTGAVSLVERSIKDLKTVGKMQLHTISRHTPKTCAQPSAPTLPTPPTEKVILDGNAFFAFDKSGIDDLQPVGRVRLATLIKHLKTNFQSIDSIQVDGYTDRFGGMAYNEKLSQARANTIRQYFIQHGINAPITAKGWGPANPLVECDGQASQAVTDCLYPNRRIEVLIKGEKTPTP